MGRQRSRNHMREENRDTDIMESSNLTDAEFKTLVVKMLNELLGYVDKFCENFNKEIKMEMEMIKENQSEMKNTLPEMRSILNGINRANKKDRTTYKEDGKAKDTQSEWQEKRCQDYKHNLRSYGTLLKVKISMYLKENKILKRYLKK